MKFQFLTEEDHTWKVKKLLLKMPQEQFIVFLNIVFLNKKITYFFLKYIL